jgi:hypothetical protein
MERRLFQVKLGFGDAKFGEEDGSKTVDHPLFIMKKTNGRNSRREFQKDVRHSRRKSQKLNLRHK